MLKMNIGENIKKYRNLNNMSQSELSKRLGVSDKTVSSWEINRTEPKMGTIEKMCAIFNCSKSDLLGIVPLDPPKYDSSQMELIRLYSMLNENQKQSVMNLLHSFVDNQNK